ncbi:MAG TPA: QsdR family transcriptional regulator [Acidimicrobiales bacterium]
MARLQDELSCSTADGWSSRRVLTYEEAVHRAIRVFVRDGGLDMRVLAEEIPVGRATLYRVVGSRNRLLGDVLWTLAERTLRLAALEATSTGLERIIETSRRFKEHTLGFGPLRTFLRTEPQTAFQVLLTPAGRVSERLVRAWIEILRQAVEAEELTLPFDVEWFAYVFVRTGESMVYSDLLAGRDPDLELAELVQRLLFRAS